MKKRLLPLSRMKSVTSTTVTAFFALASIVAAFSARFVFSIPCLPLKLSMEGRSEADSQLFLFGLVVLCGILYMFYYYALCWLAYLPLVWTYRFFEFVTEWPIEYRADRFAHRLGFGHALVKLFERVEDEDIRGDIGFLSKYLYSHPPTALRIDQLERNLSREAA